LTSLQLTILKRLRTIGPDTFSRLVAVGTLAVSFPANIVKSA